jgi:hypothetical protein
VNSLLRHLITTTSESKVQEYLVNNFSEAKKAFVLTTRISNDDSHIRYDVFSFVKNNNE